MQGDVDEEENNTTLEFDYQYHNQTNTSMS